MKMKKRFLLALFTLVIVIAIAATVNMNLKSSDETQLGLTLNNIEALADTESSCPKANYCEYTDSFGSKCSVCCPGKNQKCNIYGCTCG